MLTAFAQPASAKKTEKPIQVASYYFGNYHLNEPRNEVVHGKGWSEWELVKNAKPRFPGHQQPHVPLWGYEDESDPKVMAKKIDAASKHGIDAFIFDWYDYNGPFLESTINKGFLKAKNRNKIKFALMWANHDWLDIQPARRENTQKLLYPGKVDQKAFDRICDHVIKDYFLQPNYWKIDGKPYFSIYDPAKFIESFGSVEAAKVALDGFRAKAVAAGLPGIHLNVVIWNPFPIPGETAPTPYTRAAKIAGYDSVSSYVWIHHAGLPEQATDYNYVRDQYLKYYDRIAKEPDLPYFPNVTMGWDPSPRAAQDQQFGSFGYPFMNTIKGNTPQRFKEALQLVKDRLLAQEKGPRIMNINCWNEWTEGSYLEPDTVHKFAYLDAIRDVFGK
ncbi:hypothetical protein EON83_10180 [bacterium]|nr:MAG: hypothetical protein EON83_10180 [bacterium]